VRVALVSPYSWTYPGGVTRHIEALATELMAQGHEARVLAPVDRDTPRTARAHLGRRPADRALPDWLVPLGGTIGLPANGAVSNIAVTPYAVTRLRSELASGGYDVVHVHAPEGPVVAWDALCSTQLPMVGTFHSYNPRALTHLIVGDVLGGRRRYNRLHVRIAVSEAAAWQMRRFYGGRYRIVPNGVHVPATLAPKTPGDRLEVVFVGQAVERKGLPVLLRAFEALRDHVPARLTVVGATAPEVAPLLLDDDRRDDVVVLGTVDDAAKARALAAADVLCAPSLGGESFGMVLTEAFAHGTPVVASDIAGYRDVVRHGADGLLVPRGDAAAVAEALRTLALDPRRRAAMGAAARERAARFAWPQVTREVLDAYADAIAVPAPQGTGARVAARLGFTPADGLPPERPVKLPSLEPPPSAAEVAAAATPRRRALRAARRGALALAALGAGALSVAALDRVGVDAIGRSLLASSPVWVLVALALMGISMVLRAEAWRAILRAALPDANVRRTDALQGTMIGVLMSATLPARLGEPARAYVVARRLGRPRERLPTVVGTLVPQTLLNILALVILGATTVSALDLFRGEQALLGVVIAPVAVLLCVLVAPLMLRAGGPAAVRRAVTRLRDGLRVLRRPRLAAVATGAQLSAWAVQWLACWVLLAALGLDALAGAGAAAAVLFAVNVTAVVPVTPSNVGVFQAACVLVLGRYGVDAASAIAYGVVLQAVEVATALIMGAPALIREGLSWKDVRLRALHAAPVTLAPLEPVERRS